MTDGLYRVETLQICAGFYVECGKIIWCAPILRRKLNYWISIAKLVDENVE